MTPESGKRGPERAGEGGPLPGPAPRPAPLTLTSNVLWTQTGRPGSDLTWQDPHHWVQPGRSCLDPGAKENVATTCRAPGRCWKRVGKWPAPSAQAPAE